jgi:hypothetical protein
MLFGSRWDAATADEVTEGDIADATIKARSFFIFSRSEVRCRASCLRIPDCVVR